MNRIVSTLGALALAACGSSEGERQGTANSEQPANLSAPQSQPAIPPPGTGPDARTPLAEPKGAIDPKSVEAAGQVVQHYGALIEQGRWAEATKLWGNEENAVRFASAFKDDAETHLRIGDLGEAEGAAGSIYTTVPVLFYGKSRTGGRSGRPAFVILRRVNDVPGSTAEQRRWHIERIDLQPS